MFLAQDKMVLQITLFVEDFINVSEYLKLNWYHHSNGRVTSHKEYI